jgi:hypothetical protein
MFSWDLTRLPLTKIFWSLLAIEIVGFAGMMVMAVRTGSHAPEGPVGGWLVFLPPVAWAILALLFYSTQSPSKQLTYTVLLALPLIQVIVGPLYERIQHAVWERGWRGADHFSGSPLKLANAIYDHDAEQVKQLLPEAGDLNTPYGDDVTLFDFAMSNTDDTDASYEIIRMMLAAGGSPNIPPGRPLTLALFHTPRFARLLLDAGADPNVLDDAQRPVWWTVLTASREEDLTMLKLVLDHGADIKKRDREGGPDAWAAYQKCWRAMWLLMERGADWKDEQEFGTPVSRMLAIELEYNRHSIPDELRKALAMYNAAASQ